MQVSVRTSLGVLSAALATVFVALMLAPPGLRAQDEHLEIAKRVLSSVPMFDGHNDLPWAIRNADPPMDVRAYDISKPTQGHTDLARLRAGGVGAQFWSVYVPASVMEEGRRRPHAAGADRHRAPDHLRSPRGPRPRRHRRGGDGPVPPRQGRLHARHRGRPCDRELARRAARLPSPRRPVHDAHAQRQHRLGGLVLRSCGVRRAHRLRRRGGPGDELARHAGRHLARVARVDARRARCRGSPRHLLPLLRPRRHRPSAQRARRTCCGACPRTAAWSW